MKEKGLSRQKALHEPERRWESRGGEGRDGGRDRGGAEEVLLGSDTQASAEEPKELS